MSYFLLDEQERVQPVGVGTFYQSQPCCLNNPLLSLSFLGVQSALPIHYFVDILKLERYSETLKLKRYF